MINDCNVYSGRKKETDLKYILFLPIYLGFRLSVIPHEFCTKGKRMVGMCILEVASQVTQGVKNPSAMWETWI